jgi:hypothetical protein
MIPLDEAAASGRVEETLVPEGTFVTFRDHPPGGEAVVRENAYNTGRVKVFSKLHTERDFPRGGGVPFDAERERMKSYRTRAETYQFEPYGDAKPTLGPKEWPAKRLFPYIPPVEKVDSVEHDIVPTSRATSTDDSVVGIVDGDDSRRGFVPAKEMKGDLAMLYGDADDALHYGYPDGSGRNVDNEDLLTLVAWDSQEADWQLGAEAQDRLATLASKWATHIGKEALAMAREGKFKSVSEAVNWIKDSLLKVETKKIARLKAALVHAGDHVIETMTPVLTNAVSVWQGKGVQDYLESWPDTEDFMSLTPSAWGRAGHEFTGLHGMGADDDWKKSLVVSLDQDPAAANAVTAQATKTVNQQIATGQVSTTDQILKAISGAAQAAAQVYTAKVTGKPPPTSAMAKIGAAVLPVDQPFYKQPLFWGGLLLLGVAGTVMLTKGGGGKGRTRRRSTTRRYRRNTFPTFNRKRKAWRSRWAS